MDEASNFFKLLSLKERRSRKNPLQRSNRIADDEVLKFIIDLNNTHRIPLILIGTPEGIGMLENRMATISRSITGGYYELQRTFDPDDIYYKTYMFPILWEYQLGIPDSTKKDEFRRELLALTAGVPRIYINLWCHAQKCMIERDGKTLMVEDLRTAMDRYMAPLKPAIKAIQSGSASMMALYEDMLAQGQ